MVTAPSPELVIYALAPTNKGLYGVTAHAGGNGGRRSVVWLALTGVHCI
jgi:hypothetical protein